MSDRFVPYEAGIVNLWDYHFQTFRFEHGRLVLRGANGSGKTKALEVLVPFVLDGQLDSRRLDPFSGDSRSMRDNLLWGRDKAWSYVWLELRCPSGAAVTIGVGMRASKDATEVKRWGFAIDRARGDGWDVVDHEDRPVPEKALKAMLGEGAVAQSATAHRANVDRLLFGLGDRYDAMVELVLALRRPMLAKSLDLVQVDKTLRESLRPVDDELVERSARAFEDLESAALDLERLRHASEATTAFVGTYRTYLLSSARQRLDGAAAATAAHERAIAAAAQATDLAAAAEEADRAAGATLSSTEQAQIEATERAQGLRDSDAYRGLQQLDDLRTLVANAQAHAEQDAADAARAQALAIDARQKADEAEERRRRARSAWQRVQDEADAAAAEAGVAGTEPPLVEARRLELIGVRAAATAWERAETALAGAQRRAEEAEQRAEETEDRRARAAVAGDQAREAWRHLLDEWAVAVPEVDAEGLKRLRAAGEGVGEPGSIAPAAVLGRLLRPIREAVVAERVAAQTELGANVCAVVKVQSKRSEVLAERDDEPPAARGRSVRSESQPGAPRPGAPLWRLVDFQPEVPAADRAGLESALLATGLLDAWVTPDGSVVDGEFDAFLVGLANPGGGSGPTLADVLAPDSGGDEAAVVPASVVAAVLKAIGLGRASGLGGAPELVGAAVGIDATYRLGPLVGRAPTEEAGFVGAAARARRRIRRLADLDAQLEGLAVEAARLAEVVEGLHLRDGDLDRAEASLPTVTAIEQAVRALAEAAGRAVVAAAQRRQAEAFRDGEARAATQAKRGFVDAAGSARLAASIEAVTAAEVALHALQRALAPLGGLRVAAEAGEERWAAAVVHGESTEKERAERFGRSRGSSDDHQAVAARLAAVEESLGADAGRVAADLAEVDTTIHALARSLSGLRAVKDQAGRQVGTAVARAEAARDAVGQAEWAAHRSEVLLRPFAHAGVALACGLDSGQPWRHALERSSKGRSPSDDSLRQARTAVFGGFEQLEKRLGGRLPPHVDEEDSGLLFVTVEDEGGPEPVAVVARRLAERVAEQAAYLSQRERTVFEDALLGALVDQLHHRTDAARLLVHGMNDVLARHRTSSGLGVALAWVPVDGVPAERRRLLHLLEAGAPNLSVDELDEVRRLLADEVRVARAEAPDDRYREVLGKALDYRSWRVFELSLLRQGDDGPVRERLTKSRYGTLSGGEKSVALHLPLFAAAHATFAGAADHCPRLIALDEAFEGIDETGRDELLVLTVDFDLDLFLTGHRLWVTSPRVPGVAHYELVHDQAERLVAGQRIVWNGHELVEEDEDEAA